MLVKEIDYSKKIEIEGGYLKPLALDDLYPGYIKGLNDPLVNKYLVSVRENPLTKASATEFIDASSKSDNEVLLGIWVNGQSDFIGTVRVHSVELTNRTAEIGICSFEKSSYLRDVINEI